LAILLHSGHRSRTGNKVEIKHATNGVVLEILVARSVLVDQDVHAIGVEEQDTMRARSTVLKVERVSSIEVGVGRNAIAVLIPHRADVVGRLQAKRVGVLAQTVQVRVRRQAGAEAEILRFEDERCRRGVEDDLAGFGAGDVEGEGVRGVAELEIAQLRWNCASGPREDGFGDLVDLIAFVLNEDMNAVRWRLVS
jgi:hypothetical protein